MSDDVYREWAVTEEKEADQYASGWFQVGPVMVPWYGREQERCGAREIAEAISGWAERASLTSATAPSNECECLVYWDSHHPDCPTRKSALTSATEGKE